MTIKRDIDLKTAAGRLSAKELALYLGCYVKVIEITGTSILHREGHAYEMGPQELKDYGTGEITITPVLRPLNDIVEAEVRGLLSLNDIERIIIGDVWFANEFKWLLAHHFDLFGWIDAGLAIDANTLESNPYTS